MEMSITESVSRSIFQAAGGGKQLRMISAQGTQENERMMDYYICSNEAVSGSDFVPALSIEDEDFLSDLIPSPPLDELEDMVYDMGAEHFLSENEVFETVTNRTEQISKIAPAADGTFVRHPNEKDVISVRGFGKSRPGSLKFRELVRKHHHAYQRSDSLDFKRNLAQKIWDELLPGRFLKKDYLNQDAYRVMDEEETLTKIMFAMRDCKTSAPIRRAKAGEEDPDHVPTAKSEKVTKKPRVKKEADSVGQYISSSPLGTRRSKLGRDFALVDSLTQQSFSSSSFNPAKLNPEYLYEHEIDQLNVLFKDGILSEAYTANSTLPSRAQDIFALIQDIVTKAADLRRRECSSLNDEWFTAESQLKIRHKLLERCRACMSHGQSPNDFYEHLSQTIFRDGLLPLDQELYLN